MIRIPFLLLAFSVLATSEPPDSGMKLDPAMKTQTVEQLIKELNANYVQPTVAKNIDRSLRAWTKTDEFSSVTDGKVFADRIMDLMKKEVSDAHLRLHFHPEKLPARNSANVESSEEIEADKKMARRTNGGFAKVERLQGNVGYLKVNFFFPLHLALRPMSAAMNFVADTDALILDLRDHGGGHAETADYFTSYFFPAGKPTLLASVYNRKTNKTIQVLTASKLVGARYTKPIFVLVSYQTGSGGESPAYNLKAYKRAELLGETTRGMANMGEYFRINDHFMALIPYAQSRSPITGTNWESTGVPPTIPCDPKDSLRRAHIEAVKAVIKSTTDQGDEQLLSGLVKRLEDTPQAN